MRHLLGSWTCPSGNSVDVFLNMAPGDTPKPMALAAEWDRFPPSRKDARHWQTVILPEVAEAVVRVTGLRTLVVTI
jgi:hypothetical protein